MKQSDKIAQLEKKVERLESIIADRERCTEEVEVKVKLGRKPDDEDEYWYGNSGAYGAYWVDWREFRKIHLTK